MTFARTMRLIWIDAVLSAVGSIRRNDIKSMFAISTPQASLDLRIYQELFPAGIAYDRRSKAYRRVGAGSLFPVETRNAVVVGADAVLIGWMTAVPK